jgi:hypothetical protein
MATPTVFLKFWAGKSVPSPKQLGVWYCGFPAVNELSKRPEETECVVNELSKSLLRLLSELYDKLPEF